MPNSASKQTTENITFLIYLIFLAIVSYFHEPWFDESQAWLIARDSNPFEMLWNVLRYEGHTPLWHLLLYVPAHSGMPFELGLKLVNLTITALACWVFLKYSPFPLIVRLLIPFTYFPFYQYGVISRCYSLLVLILWIIAAIFPKRNHRPYVFSLLLTLLGATTVYGMLIAFSIAIAWLIELMPSYKHKGVTLLCSIRQLFSDRRFHSLIFLGLFNVGYLAMLWPKPDRLTPPIDYHFTVAERIYRLLMAPVGALFLSETDDFLTTGFSTLFPLFVALVGFFLIAAFFIWASYNKTMFCYVTFPYLFLTFFMTFVYFSKHHTGVYTLLILFAFWISCGHNTISYPFRWTHRLLIPSPWIPKYRPLFAKIGIACMACILSIQLYWSYTASINDIRLPYAPYREMASFMHKYLTGKYKIFDYYYLSNYRNAYFTANLAVLSYFPNNLFYNLNPDNPKISFAQHRKLNDHLLFDRLKNSGKPDFIIWHRDPLPFYKDLFSLSDYAPIKGFSGFYMWKDTLSPDNIVIYARRDILPQLKSVDRD